MALRYTPNSLPTVSNRIQKSFELRPKLPEIERDIKNIAKFFHNELDNIFKSLSEKEQEDLKETIRFFHTELLGISQSINDNIEIPWEVASIEPSKRKLGMIKFADGTLWNPGAGRGLYVYNNDRWEHL